MTNINQRSSNARIVSIVVVFGIIPAWFFYIGIQYNKTIRVLQENQEILDKQLFK